MSHTGGNNELRHNKKQGLATYQKKKSRLIAPYQAKRIKEREWLASLQNKGLASDVSNVVELVILQITVLLRPLSFKKRKRRQKIRKNLCMTRMLKRQSQDVEAQWEDNPSYLACIKVISPQIDDFKDIFGVLKVNVVRCALAQ